MIYWVIKKNIYSKINRIVYLFEFMINAMFHLMYNKVNKPTEKNRLQWFRKPWPNLIKIEESIYLFFFSKLIKLLRNSKSSLILKESINDEKICFMTDDFIVK